ncbi:BamA/TamA family outer membrane protein [Rivularia sp. PCC 7116]|uniref:BamA/TamA family outer membrane protein n=1 Tax=Rivularia sp. PCC 7116 TaxID=373994 RepID=UPI0002F0753B|nr:BamA/TamA family outer membrane protein [Rivularia sp. PCC 7116]
MRLSPFLAAVMAFATALGVSPSANAQNANTSKESQKIFQAASDNPQKTVRVSQQISDAEKLQVVIPTTKSTTAQNTPQIPPPNNLPEGTQQPAPQPAPADAPPTQPQIPPTLENNQAPVQQTNPSQLQQQQQQQFQTPGTRQQQQQPAADETRVLVSEVLVRSESGQLTPQLQEQVYRVIRTQPGRTTTRSQLQEDINAIFGTGFFSNVQVAPEDTPLGVRVSFVVQANPVLQKVQINANPGTKVPSVLPEKAVDELFSKQYGQILNLRELQEGIKELVKKYQDQGYVLANVIGAPQVSPDGVVTLQLAEGVVEDIRVQFRNKDGEATNEDGQPVKGRTQPYIVKREIQLEPGGVFNRNTVQRDLQRVFGLGLFEDVNVSLDPGDDPSQVDVIVNVVERNSGSIAAGAGISSASGLFGTISYQEQNLNGRNQDLGAELQLGVREFLFDLRFTDPWIAGDPYRTSYTVNAFRRRSISLIFDGDDEEIETADTGNDDDDRDRPRVVRTGGGVNFNRPLNKNPYKKSEWVASAGLQYQRVTITNGDGDTSEEGAIFVDGVEEPNSRVDLSASGDGEDDLFLVKLGASRDKRNNPLQPTKGSFLRLGIDQSVPIGQGTIAMTKLRGSYSQYIPVDLTNFSKGAETLAFNVQAGTVLGDLPPYEAFSLGGSNSVRGYDEGALSSGRSYVEASVEYRFPLFSVLSGALFVDVGSDLGTTTEPAEVLDKNGTGVGYGLGVRVQSPLGPIRIDYGLNDDGDSRINFGIGERF